MNHRFFVYSLILIVVLHEASATVVVALADRPPFEFGIGILLGSTVGGSLIALALSPTKLWSALSPPTRLLNRFFGLMLLSRFDWPVLALGAYLIGITPIAIIWAFKPVMFILCLRRFVYGSDGQRRYRTLNRTAWVCLAVAAAGIVLVAIGRPNQTGVDGSWLLVPLGVLVGLASTVLAGLSGIRLEWGRRLVQDRNLSQLPIITFGLALVGFPTSLLLMLIYRLGGSWPSWDNLWPGIIVGLIIASGWAIATAAWLKVRRLEVGGLFYLTPLISVALLVLVGRLGDINLWLVGVGGLLVIGSSLALVQVDRRSGTNS